VSGKRGFSRGGSVAATVLVALFVLAPPAFAVEFPVDDLDDAPDAAIDGNCNATGPNTCTLRAAIQEANDTSAEDSIVFDDPALPADPLFTIDVSGHGALPAIAESTLLDGCSGVAGPPCVTVREESGGGTVDIFRVTGPDVTIRGFAIGNGVSGIFVDGGSGTVVAGNAIGVTTSDAWKGLDLSNAGPGVRIRDGMGALIGGDTPASENVIANSAGPAIAVLPTSTLNQIGRNRGWGNGSHFIDLGGDGFGNPSGQNDGVVAPQVALAASSFVQGTAAPNATVLVFQALDAAGTSPSSILGFLGQTTAGANGAWRLDLSGGIGSGMRITALQTLAGNSSELALAAAVDVDGPAVSITAGPSGPTNDPTPTFSFLGEAGASMTCAFAGVNPFGACDSDVAYTPQTPLPDGGHSFLVRAVDAAGNESIKVQEFSVDTFIRTAIRRAPGERRVFPRVTYKFRAEEAGEGDDEDRFVEELGATFACKLDARPFRPCSSPQRYRGLSRGRHVFRVAATDDVGNVDDTPARDTFTIVKPRHK
jgi:hypothetical protein